MMWKKGDVIQRKAEHRQYWWEAVCKHHGLAPEAPLVVQACCKDSVAVLGSLYDPDRFELYKQPSMNLEDYV